EIANKEAAKDRSDDLASREDGPEHAKGPVPVLTEVICDKASRGRLQCSTADCLQCPENNEHVDVGGEPTRERGDREEADADEEDPATTELVAQLAGDRQRNDHTEAVDRDRPPRPVDSRAQSTVDCGKRGRND